MDNPEQYKPRLLSFCTGIRGLERGIETVIGRCNIAAYVEIEAFAIANLIAGMEQGIVGPGPIWTDIKTFPSNLFRRKVDIITGGYPCQPFSNAGKRKGQADPRHLWPHFKRAIDIIRPVSCFFENVPGHLTLGYREVRQSMESMGYAVAEGIYSAEEVGAPHRRERLFILAISARELLNWQREAWRRGDEFANGSELAHPDSDGWGKRPGNSTDESEETERASWEQNGQWLRNEFGNGGKNVADGVGQGLERQRSGGSGTESEITLSSSCYDYRWPARPGEQQHNWEEPRTVEPGVGLSVDGYDFREDLLRALGNAVVWQTAAKAFAELMWKCKKNI